MWRPSFLDGFHEILRLSINIGTFENHLMTLPQPRSTMFLTNANIAHRVASRYLRSRSNLDPRDHAVVWTIPPHEVDIPDDIVVQCSDGCTVTTQDVEAAIAKTRGITRGSCRFSDVHANDGTNKVRFKLILQDGQSVGGTVTVNVIAREEDLTAFSVIELDDEPTRERSH